MKRRAMASSLTACGAIYMLSQLATGVQAFVPDTGHAPAYPRLQQASLEEMMLSKTSPLDGAGFKSKYVEGGEITACGVGKHVVEENALPVFEPLFDIGDLVIKKLRVFDKDFDSAWYNEFVSAGLCFEEPCYAVSWSCDGWRPCHETVQRPFPKNIGHKCIGNQIQLSSTTALVQSKKWHGSYIRLCNLEGVEKLFGNECNDKGSYLHVEEPAKLPHACKCKSLSKFGGALPQTSYLDLWMSLKKMGLVKRYFVVERGNKTQEGPDEEAEEVDPTFSCIISRNASEAVPIVDDAGHQHMPVDGLPTRSVLGLGSLLVLGLVIRCGLKCPRGRAAAETMQHREM